jgi:hypothetical protein
MQCDRAQDQFSEYIENALSPAMRQVFEQHLSTCAACRSDLEQLRVAYTLLDEGLPILEPPPTFRASVLNAIREQPVPETFLTRVRSWFAPTGAALSRRVPAIGVVAGAILVAFAGGTWLSSHNIHVGSQPPQDLNDAALIPWAPVPVDVQNDGGILQGVRSYASADGKTYHVFGLHLPARMPATDATAYVVQSPAALTDDAALQNPSDATKAWSGSVEPGVSIQVPVAVVSNVPAGTTMTFLVEWNDASGAHKEACILPISDPAPQPMVVEPGEPLYQALQTVAVAFRRPLLLNDAAVAELTQPISQGLDNTDTTLNDSLADLVIPSNLSFQEEKDGSYLIDS